MLRRVSVALGSICRRGQNATTLCIAAEIGKRCECELSELGIPGVWGYRSSLAGCQGGASRKQGLRDYRSTECFGPDFVESRGVGPVKFQNWNGVLALLSSPVPVISVERSSGDQGVAE